MAAQRMNFLKQLREAARTCSNVEYRDQLKAAADEVERAAYGFYMDICAARMVILNGAWANAVRILKNVPPEGDPSPVTGAPEAARLAT
jgi:hypothetical protein